MINTRVSIFPPPRDVEYYRGTLPSGDKVSNLWYRCHDVKYHDDSARDRGVSFYSGYPRGGVPLGRFDLAHPRGTLYVGSTIDGSVREKLGSGICDIAYFPADLLIPLCVSKLEFDWDVATIKIINSTTPGCEQYIPLAVFSGNDYKKSSAYGEVFYQASYAGIVYRARYSYTSESLALFGRMGRPKQPAVGKCLRDWRDRLTTPIFDKLSSKAKIVALPPGWR